jgi:hypothetical protein
MLGGSKRGNVDEIVEAFDRAVTEAGIQDPLRMLRDFVQSISDRASGEASDESVAERLRLVGDSFASEARIDEALVAYSELEHTFRGSTSPDVLNHVVPALMNKARLMEGHANLDATISAYDNVIGSYSKIAQPSIEILVQDAYFAKAELLRTYGLSHGDPSFVERALNSFLAIDEAYHSSSDPSIQEWVAKAMYNAADTYGLLGRDDEADAQYSSLIHRFQDSVAAAVKDVVSSAEARRFLLAVPPAPSAYVVDHPLDLGILLDCLERLSHVSSQPEIDEVELGIADTRADMKQRRKAILASHSKAAEILLKYRQAGYPFALLLRSFDIEALSRDFHAEPLPGSNFEEYTATVTSMNTRGVEEALVSRRVPLITIGNSADYHVSLDEQIPRLFLDPTNWIEVVKSLIKAAYFIVARVDRLSPGMILELELIGACGRQEDTVVVLSRAPQQDENADPAEFARRAVASAGGEHEDIAPPAEAGSIELSQFRRIIYEDQFVPDDAANAHELEDLVGAMVRFASLEPSDRVCRLLEASRSERT